MQFISGRVLIVGNNQIIQRENYQFSSVIFVIKKKMDGKIRTIAFECVGKLADEVLKLNIGEKIEVKYLIVSSLRKDKWYTNLHAKEIFKYGERPKIKDVNQIQLNIKNYDDTFEESFEG